MEEKKKLVLKRCDPTHKLWMSRLHSHIFSSNFFSMALLKQDPWNSPAADRGFSCFSKEAFMCMDGQEQAMSDSVH